MEEEHSRSVGGLDLDGEFAQLGRLGRLSGHAEVASMKETGAGRASGGLDRRLCAALAVAQLLSLALALTGITSQSLALHGVDVPTTQSLLNYLLLAATYGVARALQRRPLAQPWWVYALLCVLDVEGNFLVTKAYQYTSITSATLLDCFTLPAVMLLSCLVLRARYKAVHYVGAATCVAGLGLLVVTDAGASSAGPAPLLGDALVLAGALCYAVNNVAQEKLLGGDVGVLELLAMQGVCGSVLAGLQVLLLERHQLAALQWQPGTLLPLLGFAGALYTFYSLVPAVLIWGGATLLNLSLLSSDLWAALARLLLFGGFEGSSFAYFAGSLALVAAGTAVYARGGASKPLGAADGAAGELRILSTSSLPYQRLYSPQLDEEAGGYPDGAGPQALGRHSRASLDGCSSVEPGRAPGATSAAADCHGSGTAGH